MSPFVYEICTRVHGHIAILGLAVLLHPILSMPSQKALRKGTRWSLWLSMVLVGIAYAMGLWLYPEYRSEVKPRLISEHIALAYMFERKEHLAFLCCFSVTGGGLLSLFFAFENSRTIARAILLWGWLCGFLVACMGVLVASA